MTDRGRTVALGVSAFALFFVLFLTGLGPFDFDFHGGDAEGSWIVASTYAGLHHFIYGTQFVFTNGPLFPLYHREVAGDETGWYVLARLAVVLYLAYGFARLSATERRAGWLVVLVAFGLLFPTISRQANDATLLVVPLLTAMLVLAGRSNWLGLAMGVILSAALGLAKLSFIPFCLGAFVLTDIALSSRRQPPLTLAGYIAATFGLFLVAGQHVQDFAPFLAGAYEMTAGYSAALSLDNSLVETGAFLLLCALVVGFVLLKEIAAVRRGEARAANAVLMVLLVAGFLFIAFKAGFVRQDSHSIASWGMLAYLVLLLGLPGALAGWPLRTTVGLYALPVLGFAVALALFARNPYLAGALTESPGLLAQQVAQATAFAMNPPAWLARQQQRSADWDAYVRKTQPLPALSGTVDAISNVQQAVIAAGLDFAPRPTLQENMTFSPALIARNRTYLSGPDAPANLIFAPGATDKRHPASVEGALWPLLLSDYAVTDHIRDQLILTRRATPLTIATTELPAQIGRFGADMPLPQVHMPIVMTLGIRETWWGKLVDQAYKPPIVRLVVEYADGKTETYRLIPGMISEGMLIAPTVTDAADYERLAHGNSGGLRFPAAVRIETAGAWAYEPAIPVSFETLAIPSS